MIKFEKILSNEMLDSARNNLVPHIMSENYFRILKAKVNGKKLTTTEQYYYNHFIKKKILAMTELFRIEEDIIVNGKEFILKERLYKAKKLLKKIERTHRGQKILISGSFLYKKEYNDIDIFIISKYKKEDYKRKNIHINYLPEDAEGKLFLNSISQISIANFIPKKKREYKTNIDKLISVYQELIIYILQKNEFKQELREFLIISSYISEKTILNSKQLSFQTEKIISQKNIIQVINNILIKTLTIIYNIKMKKDLLEMIRTNEELKSETKKGDNLDIYNQTYKRVMELES